MKLLTADAYFNALLAHIPKARKRVVIHAMEVSWGQKTEQLLPLLHDALSRNVEVRLVGDLYTKFELNIPKLVRVDKTPRWGHTLGINNQLRADGAHITYVGVIGLNPFKGRCHSKITLIDNTIYSFGGVNFKDDAFTNHDYMFCAENTILADRLYSLVKDIEKDHRLPDLKEKINNTTTLLYDGGTPGQSVIYQEACNIVSNARKVYYVSQMCPSGELAKLINATENECYFIRPSQAEPAARMALMVDKARFNITNRYKGKRYIHAKFILCEGQDGSKHLVSGSNNFSWRGIAYGTKEIAVHSSDPALWNALCEYMQEIISAPKSR